MLLLASAACAYVVRGGPRLHGGARPSTLRLRGGDVAEAPQTFRFPDGSMYRGGVQDGMQHGDGEWRSAEGDVYKGSFARGTFEGDGRYTDARGNVYEGGFVGGAFQGPGSYAYVDGRAEVGAYEGGQEIGEGACWSPDRARAWRLRDGQVDGEITLEDAAAIAAALGLAIPDGIFAPPPEALARLRERIDDGIVAFAFDGHVAVPAHETVMRAGTLVEHGSVTPGGQRFAGHAEDDAVSELLRRRAWDVVVLQDNSGVPGGFNEVAYRESTHALESRLAVAFLPAAAVTTKRLARSLNIRTRWRRRRRNTCACP